MGNLDIIQALMGQIIARIGVDTLPNQLSFFSMFRLQTDLELIACQALFTG